MSEHIRFPSAMILKGRELVSVFAHVVYNTLEDGFSQVVNHIWPHLQPAICPTNKQDAAHNVKSCSGRKKGCCIAVALLNNFLPVLAPNLAADPPEQRQKERDCL